MKSRLTAAITLICLLLVVQAFACVGRTLTIGTLQSPNDDLLSQMLAVLIKERTGTSVAVVQYQNQEELYQAVQEEQVSIIIENDARARHLLGETVTGDDQAVHLALKEAYHQRFGLILLDPFGRTPAEGGAAPPLYMPGIAVDILTDYPALPRVVKKLGGITGDKSYPKLLQAVKNGEKPISTARDFLKKKRFI